MLPKIWFLLWGLLWSIYFMLDGFDLGLGALLPALAKDEKDRRTIHNAIGPYWDGNEVWLIAAGGVTFAAFPLAYAVMFSSLYSALMLALFALIFRGAAIALRHESESPAARRLWDAVLAVSSLAASFLLGAAFANLFAGIPVDGEGVFHGGLFTLLNGYALLGGALFALMFLAHGALWLAVKAEGQLQGRAGKAALRLWAGLAAATLAFLAASRSATTLYDNYLEQPGLLVIPGLAVTALAAVPLFIIRGRPLAAFIASSMFIVYVTFFGLFGMYPNLIISSLDPAHHVSIVNAASGPATLKIMLGVALVFVPPVIAYQGWVYAVFKGKADDGVHGYGGEDRENKSAPLDSGAV